MRMRSRLAALGVAALAVVSAALLTPAGSAGATGTSCSGPPIPKVGGGYWTCTFDDEFTGTKLDSTKWGPVTSLQSGVTWGGGCFESGAGNISVGSGMLRLTAKKEMRPVTCASPSGYFQTSYTEGQVASANKFSQTYGLFAIRARFPGSKVPGLESALWMWPQNTGGPSGEIDIAEEYSQYPDRVIPYVHYPYNSATTNASTGTNVVTSFNCMVNNVAAFHVYALQWTPGYMSFMVDGSVCFVDHYEPSGTSPFQQPYFLALTQALGVGTNSFQPGKTQLSATTDIDWVRVYK